MLIEILPNIHVGNIYITLPDSSESCRDVVVKKSECVVQLQSGKEQCLKLPRGMCLVPDEVSSGSGSSLGKKKTFVTPSPNTSIFVCFGYILWLSLSSQM